MALIKCPDCGSKISDSAKSCPKCGYPLADKLAEQEGSISVSAQVKQNAFPYKSHKKTIIIIAAVTAMIIVAFLIMSKPPIPQYHQGDIILFGHYEQDNILSNGAEPIEWIVLEQQGSKVFVLSKYGLDAKPYNTQHVNVYWETCELRQWLNKDFLNTVFTVKEQKAILITDVDNSSRQGFRKWHTDGGHNTQDKLFLLSYAEADQYFRIFSFDTDEASNILSRAAPTSYAIRHGAYSFDGCITTDKKDAGCWWLRSPGEDQDSVIAIGVDGSFYYHFPNNSSYIVRPALWIDLGLR